METLTITLTPELKSRLDEVAAERHVPLPDCALELLVAALHASRHGAGPAEAAAGATLPPEPERLAAIDEAVGLLTGASFTVDDFLREKHEETLRQERRNL